MTVESKSEYEELVVRFGLNDPAEKLLAEFPFRSGFCHPVCLIFSLS
jgi:hypothetical protein